MTLRLTGDARARFASLMQQKRQDRLASHPSSFPISLINLSKVVKDGTDEEADLPEWDEVNVEAELTETAYICASC